MSLWTRVKGWFQRPRKQFYAWSYKVRDQSQPVSPEDEVQRGGRAQRVLGDEIYKEAFDTIQARIVGLLAQSETTGERRERLNHLLVAHTQVRQYMEQVVIGGKMAAEQIERERTLKERMLRRIA